MIFRPLNIKRTESIRDRAGFTLIELMVTMAIFGIITSIVVGKNSDFNNSILLTNLAYETALSIREAQVYGLNVKKSGSGDSAFKAGYGAHFNKDNNKQFIIFSDIEATNAKTKGTYNDGKDMVIDKFALTRGNFIAKLCVEISFTPPSFDCNMSTVDIVFTRPDPDALIKINGETFPFPMTRAEIVLASPSGNKRKVIVNSTGAISVEICPVVTTDKACQ